MTKTKTWGILALGVILVVVVAGWFLALAPQRAKVTKLHDSAAAQVEANQTLKNRILLLEKQQKQMPSEQARIGAIADRIPSTPAMTGYVRTLALLATANHLELISVGPSGPAPVQVAAAPGAAAATPAASGAAGMSSIRIAIDVVGDYYNVEQFLKKLEATQRATIVSSIEMQPGQLPVSQGGAPNPTATAAAVQGVSWTTLDAHITATVFMSGDATAVTTTTGAPATAAPTPTTSPAAAAPPANGGSTPAAATGAK